MQVQKGKSIYFFHKPLFNFFFFFCRFNVFFGSIWLKCPSWMVWVSNSVFFIENTKMGRGHSKTKFWWILKNEEKIKDIP